MSTEVKCNKRKCLNNKNGVCTAQLIEYDGLCQTYITHDHAPQKVIVDYALVRTADLRENSRDVIKIARRWDSGRISK